MKLLPDSPPSAYHLLTFIAAAAMFAALLAAVLYNAAQSSQLDHITEANTRNVQEHRVANQADHNKVHDEHRQLCEMLRQIAERQNITTEPCQLQVQ